MDTDTDRFGHSRPCAYGIGVAETGHVVEVVLAGRVEAQARAETLTRRHAAAALLVPAFWTEVNAWAERQRKGDEPWDDAFDARWRAEQDRWLGEKGVHPEDREFVWSILIDEKVRVTVPYDVFPLPLSPVGDAQSAAIPVKRTPGEILREQIAQRARDKLASERRAAEEALAKERRHKQIIRDALDAGLARAVSAILSGEILKPVKLPGEFQDYRLNGITVSGDRHPDHAIFVEFEAKARAQGLVPLVSYQHDGGGMSSWHELSFEPA